MQHVKDYIEIINKMVVEKGNRNGKIFTAELTTKNILERMDLPNTAQKQRYVVHVVKHAYPESKISRANHDDGWLINLKIRAK